MPDEHTWARVWEIMAQTLGEPAVEVYLTSFPTLSTKDVTKGLSLLEDTHTD